MQTVRNATEGVPYSDGVRVMNRLFRVLHRWKCKSAAQKLALDALRHLDGDDESRRGGLLLWHVESYLRGIDAPEAVFRDHANHVLYPVEGWGGAARLSRKWYWTTVETLRSRDWTEAAYSAGVLARYVTFPFFPLRTGHDEAALALRRPVEWCLGRLYAELTRDVGEPRPARVPSGDDWLERLVVRGAEEAHCHFRSVASRFDLAAVIEDPATLDDELKAIHARLLKHAAATAGAVLARAIAESGAEPPRYPLGTAGLLALPSLPLFWATRVPSQARESRAVRAMVRELRETGRIEATLPEDARAVRDAYELEVLKRTPRTVEALLSENPSLAHRASVDVALARSASGGSGTSPTGRGLEGGPALRAGTSASERRTTLSSPIASAPFVGTLGARLEATGVATVGELLAADADEVAASLHPQASATDVAAWQDQARLLCAISPLSTAEAELLVACGVTGPEDLAALSPVELWELVVPVAESPDGRRLLHGEAAPDLDAITRWIDAARRPRQAA